MHVSRSGILRLSSASTLCRISFLGRRIGLFGLGLGLSAALIGCDGGQAVAPTMGPTEVSVITIEPRRIEMVQDLPGRTVAAKVAEIRPQVSGIVTQRLFTEGAVVQAGQQLYQIDDATYRADLQRAKAELQRAEAAARVAKARMDRYEDLVRTKAVSQQEFDDAQANYDQARANIAAANAAVTAAEINLRYTKVHAPISGRIGISQVTEGALVTQNQAQALTRITQLDPIYVDMPQSSTDFWQLRERLSQNANPVVSLTVDGVASAYEHQGQLQFGDVTVDESTGSVRLRAVFPNPEHKLLPGLFIKARVNSGEQDAVLVPQRATQRDPGGALRVWRVEADNTVQPVVVTAIRELGDQWIVADGISSGDVIVMQGYHKLRPGAPVRTTAFQSAPQANSQKLAGLH